MSYGGKGRDYIQTAKSTRAPTYCLTSIRLSLELSSKLHSESMAIPKVIYQTFSTKRRPPLVARLVIWWFMRRNKSYRYEYYDDERIDTFIKEEFPPRYYAAYKRLQIGAARADFFRYAILYKRGGIYLDLDGLIRKRLDDYLHEDDQAVIALERSTKYFYCQWALIFAPGHPFLLRTLRVIINSIETGKFQHSVHALTGPSAYTYAVRKQLSLDPDTPHRVLPYNYDNLFWPRYFPKSKILLYGTMRRHWRSIQKRIPAYTPPTEDEQSTSC